MEIEVKPKVFGPRELSKDTEGGEVAGAEGKEISCQRNCVDNGQPRIERDGLGTP